MDVWEFVAAFDTCAHSKSSHVPAGLLHPLPVPSPPIALDCVTGLLPSEGNSIIMSVVDHSKAVHTVPLPKLPSALQTANILV